AAIDEDIADMGKRLEQPVSAKSVPERTRMAIREVLARPKRPSVAARHTPAVRFEPGKPLAIEISLEKGNGRVVRLHYRRVNQAETWRAGEMEWRDNRYRGVIPADYTQSEYPLQYYFELHEYSEGVWLYPGFGPELPNTPYFVARRA